MDPAVTSARHFARLVGLLVNEAPNVEEQKATLRAFALAMKDGPLALEANDEQLGANGMVVSTAFAGVTDVTARMAAHNLRGIDIQAGAGAGELLGIARLLAGTPVADDAAAERQRSDPGAKNVRFTHRAAPGALPELELLEPVEETSEAPRRARLSSTDVAPRGDSGTGGMFDQFAPISRTSSASPQELLSELAKTSDSTRLDHLLEYLVAAAEQAMLDTKPALVSDILWGIVQRDAAAAESTDKRLLSMALRKLAKPAMLQAVARQLPRTQDRREQLMAVLTRMGEDGADALIEQIATASQQSDRRIYFDALLRLQAGIPTLIHMLGDTRWFVARNAADLLGEMQAREAEQPLTWLLQHDDDRIRRSATTALMRLGTPRALQAIHDTLKDGVPQMRIQAAAALVARQDVRTASALVRALETEKDEEVQDAFLLALGRLGTTDAVQRLLAAAEPERGFFKTKRTTFRIAAIQGLAEARSAEAVACLNSLLHDKEADVRDAASFALGRIARQDEAK